MENPPPSYIEISEDEVEELQEDQDAEMPTNDDQAPENQTGEFETEEMEEVVVGEDADEEADEEGQEEEDEGEDQDEVEDDEMEDDIDEDYAVYLEELSARNGGAGVAIDLTESRDAAAFETESRDAAEDEEEEDDDEDEEVGDGTDTDYAAYFAEVMAARNGGAGVAAVETVSRDAAEEGGEKRRRIGEPETAPLDGSGSSQSSEWNRNDIDGLICPICFDAWTGEGDHRICCLPCGHIFGMSCIMKWLQRSDSKKCPQCNQKCKLKDIRKLFSSQVVSVNEESQKRIRILEDKCASLGMKVAVCCRKEDEWLKREAELNLKIEELETHHEGCSTQISVLEEELLAERALRHRITLSRAKDEQRFLSFERSLLQWWDQVAQQLQHFVPGFVAPTVPVLPPPETQPDQHVGEEDHT